MPEKLIVYNSLTKNKEIFEPLVKNNVGIYVCGPTVYNEVHLGNCRTFISFDMIVRYLKYLGYKVKYVRNITDVGHLENDSDFGEDKMEKMAKREKVEPMEIAQKYTNSFHNILNKFNTLAPSIEPTATGHIYEQIEMIEKIMADGYAYVSEGSVYFDISKYEKKFNYGELSGRKTEELEVFTRELTGGESKKNPFDFALWKLAPEKHIMKWKSPWGVGFPGWHIECSAMSKKYLGETFDIHGGGMDLKFPHHECEIAQSKSINSKNPVKYWLHGNMLELNGKRMSKTEGNFILPLDLFSGKNNLFSKGYDPMVVKFFMYQSHYSSTLNITEEGLMSAEKGLNRMLKGIKTLNEITPSQKSTFDVTNIKKECQNVMNDDFNTPKLIAILFDGLTEINNLKEKKTELTEEDINILKKIYNDYLIDVLGIEIEEKKEDNKDKIDKLMQLIITLRKSARENKNYKDSDIIREELNKIGIKVNDNKENTTWEN